MSDNVLLEIKGLKICFYTFDGVVKAIDGLDLTVYEDETLGVVGETGCGKSITALSVLNLVPPPGVIEAGEIHFEGENLLTKSKKEMIGMALSCRPRLLIADEPSTALDVTIQAQILRLMRDLKREMKTSILLITHNLGVVAQVCQRVAVMYAGTIVELGDLRAIFKQPKHPYTAGLLRTIPHVGHKQEQLDTIEGRVPNLMYPPPGCRFHPRCPQAMEVCRQARPAAVEVGAGHQVACHLYSAENMA
jgi:peptide/nickel transport system ATP-binding protein